MPYSSSCLFTRSSGELVGVCFGSLFERAKHRPAVGFCRPRPLCTARPTCVRRAESGRTDQTRRNTPCLSVESTFVPLSRLHRSSQECSVASEAFKTCSPNESQPSLPMQTRHRRTLVAPVSSARTSRTLVRPIRVSHRRLRRRRRSERLLRTRRRTTPSPTTSRHHHPHSTARLTSHL